MTDVNIGKIIHDRRSELGLTMKELAEKVGVAEGTISRWESGEIKNMRRDAVAALAKALNLSPKILMGWDDNEEPRAYYLNPETARMAQAIYDNPELGYLFDAAKDASPEDLRMATEILQKFKHPKE